MKCPICGSPTETLPNSSIVCTHAYCEWLQLPLERSLDVLQSKILELNATYSNGWKLLQERMSQYD